MLETNLSVIEVVDTHSEPPSEESPRFKSIESAGWDTYQLFIIPVAFQYISRGWSARDSSIQRTMIAQVVLMVDIGISNDQKHQQKQVSEFVKSKSPYTLSEWEMARKQSSG